MYNTIKLEKYYNNLYFMLLLFNSNLLNTDDILKIVNILTNGGDDSEFLINILLLDKNEKEYIYNNFKKYLELKELLIADKDLLIKKIILFIFNEILSGNIDLMNGIKFVIGNLLEHEKVKNILVII